MDEPNDTRDAGEAQGTRGCCIYPDDNGEPHCVDGVDEWWCRAKNGTWYPGRTCAEGPPA